ncbi:TraB/GumN family protein [Phaeobacter gallaeciensis]|uniref:TraB/GumN family protein n=1 Tax=Phaeobacter gallaeciensis TaxID=60890 RepID=UPI00237FFFE4|nr:TraB/GumN family protein [Phaeobacter gallaeciensis]MDE4275968.1 TraB/GumN family protein [Phaeobacter gallaeciensis]MDE4301196.1 TraB/GumN family protein [Phaeobacter gallaeciensis]MDE5186410.1 TraB/GumN family protein [Phaeobacter gallaeciensis]
MRAFLLLLLCLLPSGVLAACGGSDLRQTLSPEDRARITASIADIPFKEGNHWIATKGTRRVHVLGTLHTNDPRMEQITEGLASLITGANALLIEATEADQAAMQRQMGKTPSLYLITEGPSLIDRMGEEDWARVAERSAARGIPAWMAAKMRPWFLSVSLSLPPCLKQTEQAKNGMDRRLEALAKESGVTTMSLEDPLTVIESLNAAPLDEQVRQMHATLSMTGDGDADEFHTMVGSYFREEVRYYLAMAEQRFKAETSLPAPEADALWDEAMQMLIRERNREWVPVIEATAGDRIVVAVGALHLPGQAGVLNLLAKAGYSLERGAF